MFLQLTLKKKGNNHCLSIAAVLRGILHGSAHFRVHGV